MVDSAHNVPTVALRVWNQDSAYHVFNHITSTMTTVYSVRLIVYNVMMDLHVLVAQLGY